MYEIEFYIDDETWTNVKIFEDDSKNAEYIVRSAMKKGGVSVSDGITGVVWVFSNAKIKKCSVKEVASAESLTYLAEAVF